MFLTPIFYLIFININSCFSYLKYNYPEFIKNELEEFINYKQKFNKKYETIEIFT